MYYENAGWGNQTLDLQWMHYRFNSGKPNKPTGAIFDVLNSVEHIVHGFSGCQSTLWCTTKANPRGPPAFLDGATFYFP